MCRHVSIGRAPTDRCYRSRNRSSAPAITEIEFLLPGLSSFKLQVKLCATLVSAGHCSVSRSCARWSIITECTINSAANETLNQDFFTLECYCSCIEYNAVCQYTLTILNFVFGLHFVLYSIYFVFGLSLYILLNLFVCWCYILYIMESNLLSGLQFVCSGVVNIIWN